jgi:HIV Tat-specific factor 1
MDGRSFAGQKVEAYISEGKEHFRKSKKKDDNHETTPEQE